MIEHFFEIPTRRVIYSNTAVITYKINKKIKTAVATCHICMLYMPVHVCTTTSVYTKAIFVIDDLLASSFHVND